MPTLKFHSLSEPERPALLPDEIHVWLVDLDQNPKSSDSLNASERDRASRYHFESDRCHFTTRRTILRQLVGSYLKCSPAEVEFTTNPAGKLGVAGGLEFNLSGAGELALYGFARDRALGVDLAKCRADFQWQEVVESFFHPTEATYLRELPAPEQVATFFQLWTIKEAFVKANGGGLTQPLAREDFTPLLRTEERTRVLPDGTRWRWWGWAPTTTTVASLVIRD